MKARITKDFVDRLEKATGGLRSVHAEISSLAKKSSGDAVNGFKLKMINAVLRSCNSLLGADGVPIPDFTEFNSDDVPSNNDVTLVVAQYMEAMEKLRADNIVMYAGEWVFKVAGGGDIPTAPPAKIKP